MKLVRKTEFMHKQKILLFGSNGQIGSRLKSILENQHNSIALTRSDIDLTDLYSISKSIIDHLPNIIINAAAYTNVDKAEHESEIADLVNNKALEIMANTARNINALLICYSTEYVFDGKKSGQYKENDITNPLSVYGLSKLNGEKAVINSGCKYINLRTSWIYDAKGKNFITTIIRLAKEKNELKIIDDQIGSPTSAKLVAEVTAQIIDLLSSNTFLNNINLKHYGTYHLVSSGFTNWYKLAVYVINQLEKKGVSFKCVSKNIKSISTQEYNSITERPLNSRLDTEKICTLLDIKLPDWKVYLDATIAEINDKQWNDIK